MQRLTEEQIDKLIVLVEKQPPLYDKASPGIRNVRDKIWKEIAKKLRASETDCRTAWRSLRDQFQKANKEKGARARRHKYYEKLLFLKSVVAPTCYSVPKFRSKTRSLPLIQSTEYSVEEEEEIEQDEDYDYDMPNHTSDDVKVEKDDIDLQSYLINIFPDNSVERPEANSTASNLNLDYSNQDPSYPAEDLHPFNNSNNNMSEQQPNLAPHTLRISNDSQQVSTTTLNNISADHSNDMAAKSSSLVSRDSRGIYKFFESLATSVEACNFTTLELLQLQSKIYNFSCEEIKNILDKRET